MACLQVGIQKSAAQLHPLPRRASGSAIDVLWSAARSSQSVVELSGKTDYRLDEFLRSMAFNDLGLCQPVSQSLTLRIPHHGSRLEEKRDDICSRNQKEEVSCYGIGWRAGATVFEADYDQTKKELSDTLPSYGVPEQQVGSSSHQIPDNVRGPVQDTERQDDVAVYDRGHDAPSDIGLRVGRHQPPRKPCCNRKVHDCKNDGRQNANANECAGAHVMRLALSSLFMGYATIPPNRITGAPVSANPWLR